MNLTRHRIREVAFQTLFAMNANPKADPIQLFQALIKSQDANYPEYLIQLVDGVNKDRKALDDQISKYLSSDWTIDRIAKTDLIILRIAFYEIDNVEAVPDKVAVNEALQLAKEYSDDRSRRFINGVLGNKIK
ncbi:transcription antitermination factor NusB [Acetilactobacillus jinshanensis]|uniref:Transcription antitermination protein NusB n=1 Tax=Acetilactobacillus jinshanensis TaxID=1720083 RepID=A0A4P6ZLB9_9LACO|nr:transcription antitermination factor NusB [Acetilactobacillus jinshanensis]QBP18635.1 transcription antitermination factor NusB [Acetilactobacillus jinshanensis]URL61511.1 transcription antitermination factor NusB [uncultured bacterium]